MVSVKGKVIAGIALNGTLTADKTVKGSIEPKNELSAKLGMGVYQGNADVVTKPTHFEFPTIGNTANLYVASEENATYRWDDKDLKYYCVGRNYENIEVVTGGNANGTK